MNDRVQLTPFEIGQIKAQLYHGLGPVGISRIVKKPDGSPISHGRISLVASKLASDPQCIYIYICMYISIYIHDLSGKCTCTSICIQYTYWQLSRIKIYGFEELLRRGLGEDLY